MQQPPHFDNIGIPIVILLSKKIETFNIASRATYMLFVSCANNIIMCVLAVLTVLFNSIGGIVLGL